MPKIKAKFRRCFGVPYAIETFSGKQYRCRHCNEIFFREKELEKHIRHVSAEGRKNIQVHHSSPQLSANLISTLIYTYDIKDRMKRQWLKLKKGEAYDGPWE